MDSLIPIKLSTLLLAAIFSALPARAQNAPPPLAPPLAPPLIPPFIVGADISVLTSSENAGVTFSDNGQKADPLLILKRHGFNTVRLRLFQSPDKKRELVNDLPYDLALAKRAKKLDLQVLLDFHYSDSWADPGKQTKPAAWRNLNFDELRGAVFETTRGAVEAFVKAGAAPDFIQIGNEINTGMLWPDGHADKDDAGWERFAQLVKAGRDGARAALGTDSKTRFIHHIADPRSVIWHLDNWLKHGELPDIIGVSYYPAWHGDLASFRAQMDIIAAKYGRPIVIAEVAYPWTDESFDAYPDVSHYRPAMGMPAHDKAGQAEFYRRFIAAILATPRGLGAGFIVWEPAWLPNEKFGSPMDNMTLFDQNGAALPSLNAIGAAVKASE